MKTIKISPLLSCIYVWAALPATSFAEQPEPLLPVVSGIKEKTDLANQSLDALRTPVSIETIDMIFEEDKGELPGIPIRDPFNASSKLGMQAPAPGTFPGGTTTFLPDPVQRDLPDIRLKGIVTLGDNNNDELLALLEVNKRDVYMVKAGDEVSYDPGKPASAIKIKHISRLSVTVEVGSLGNILVIR